MNKVLKWALIVIAALAIIGFGLMQYGKYSTKQHSPEDTIELAKGDLALEVYYNRPSKKGRDIFGGLLPYGKIWRTGANECTTFETNKNLTINGQPLPKGKYTLWTIPNENSWEVIFNSEMYGWGANFDGSQVKNDESDVLIATVPVEKLSQVVEQFEITLESTSDGAAMNLAWDDVKISVPMKE